MAYRKPDPALPKIGARLELTRRALALTRFQMARVLGTDLNEPSAPVCRRREFFAVSGLMASSRMKE